MSRVWKELGGYDRDSKYASVCESHFNPEDLIVYEDGWKWLAWTDSIILIYIEHEIYIIF